MEKLCYFNSKYVKTEDISISPFDYGFNFGAGIYEVFAFHRGIPLQMDEHLTRLSRGGDALGIPVDKTAIRDACSFLIANNQECDGYIYIQLTFGGYDKRNHHLPTTIEPTLLIYTYNVSSPSPAFFTKGYSLKTVPNIRWKRCDLKTTSLLPNILSLKEAVTDGFDDCLFVDEQNHVLECSAANVFCVEKGTLKTPPESNNILPGITRATVIKLAKANAIPLEFCECSVQQVKQADEVFITSTTKQILPVGRIDNDSIASVPGEVTTHLISKLKEFTAQETS